MISGCWVIKVTYLDFNNDVDFNEGYTTFEKCIASIKRKIEPEYMKTINDYTFVDLDEQIKYEAKWVEIFGEV